MTFKVGVIIPDRGDRPEFLYHCWLMLQRQTLRPIVVELVNDKPISDKCDITWRYKLGYDRLRNKGVDVIAFIENDDYYNPRYLESIVKEWDAQGRPDLFGTYYTVYYHLRLKKYFTMWHQDRASAMNTLIKPDLNFAWCNDDEPYTDMYLWTTIQNRKVWYLDKENPISIGMKHGSTMTGGGMHTDSLEAYDNAHFAGKDPDFLKKHVDADSLMFYEYMNRKLNPPFHWQAI